MKVEFVPQEYDDCMAVSAAEFLKADKNRDEYASLEMATDAISALYGIQYIIPREDYDVVKEWLTKSSTVVFYIRQARYGPKKWCEICVIDGPRTQRVRSMVHIKVNSSNSVVKPLCWASRRFFDFFRRDLSRRSRGIFHLAFQGRIYYNNRGLRTLTP